MLLVLLVYSYCNSGDRGSWHWHQHQQCPSFWQLKHLPSQYSLILTACLSPMRKLSLYQLSRSSSSKRCAPLSWFRHRFQSWFYLQLGRAYHIPIIPFVGLNWRVGNEYVLMSHSQLSPTGPSRGPMVWYMAGLLGAMILFNTQAVQLTQD